MRDPWHVDVWQHVVGVWSDAVTAIRVLVVQDALPAHLLRLLAVVSLLSDGSLPLRVRVQINLASRSLARSLLVLVELPSLEVGGTSEVSRLPLGASLACVVGVRDQSGDDVALLLDSLLSPAETLGVLGFVEAPGDVGHSKVNRGVFVTAMADVTVYNLFVLVVSSVT